MTKEDALKAFQELKAQGQTDEEILGAMYLMFQNDEITIDDLRGLTDALGYQLTPEFEAMSPEDQKTKGFEETGEDVSKEEVEDAKEVTPEEGGSDGGSESSSEQSSDSNDSNDSKEEENDDEKAEKLFKGNSGASNSNDQKDNSNDSEEDSNEDEDEEKKAAKLFGFNK